MKTSIENGIAVKYREIYDQRYTKVRENMLKIIENGQREAFYIFDSQSADERITLWRQFLPRVELFYAVKTNPN